MRREDLDCVFNDLAPIWYEAYDKLKEYVLIIIKNKVKDKELIEHIIDELMSIPIKEAEILTKILIDYYNIVDREAAKRYEDIYNSIYEEDNQMRFGV